MQTLSQIHVKNLWLQHAAIIANLAPHIDAASRQSLAKTIWPAIEHTTVSTAPPTTEPPHHTPPTRARRDSRTHAA